MKLAARIALLALAVAGVTASFKVHTTASVTTTTIDPPPPCPKCIPGGKIER